MTESVPHLYVASLEQVYPTEPVRFFASTKKAVSKRAGNRGDAHAGSSKRKATTILLYGRMRELALYRAEVLALKGFDVIVPRTNEEATAAVLAGGFEVAVLSYTLANNTVKELSDLIRQQCPACPLLMIAQRAEDDPHVQPDAIVNAELGPAALVDTIHRTLQRRLQ